MQPLLVDILSLICALAGWFYLFYSRAASKLLPLESTPRNTLRITLRRLCGAALFLLAIGIFAGFNSVNGDRTPRAFTAVWLAVMVLLLFIMILVYADIRLTWKLHYRTPNRGDHHRS